MRTKRTRNRISGTSKLPLIDLIVYDELLKQAQVAIEKIPIDQYIIQSKKDGILFLASAGLWILNLV